jgi:hypothetical protein
VSAAAALPRSCTFAGAHIDLPARSGAIATPYLHAAVPSTQLSGTSQHRRQHETINSRARVKEVPIEASSTHYPPSLASWLHGWRSCGWTWRGGKRLLEALGRGESQREQTKGVEQDQREQRGWWRVEQQNTIGKRGDLSAFARSSGFARWSEEGTREGGSIRNVNDPCDLSGCGTGRWFVSPRWSYRSGGLTFGLKDIFEAASKCWCR